VSAPVLAGCDQSELLARAKGLLALGNSPLQIQVALVQSGVAPELVEGVIDEIRRLARQQRDRQVQNAWRVMALGMLILVLVVGAGFMFSFRSKLFPSSATATPTQKPTPTGLAGYLMSLPTPIVQTAPTSGADSTPAPCPGSPAEAAALFGGQASDWSYKPDADGWVMTSLTSQTLHVPPGMLAGYLQFGEGGADMNQVDGPATIQNVNFAAITCY
jgi:hypothetical protein